MVRGRSDSSIESAGARGKDDWGPRATYVA